MSQLWRYTSLSRLDVLRLPGPACFTAQLSWLALLQLYTVIPFAFAFLFGVPAIYLLATGERHSARYKKVVDSFYSSLMIFLFLIFPLVTVESVQGLNCVDIEGKLWLRRSLDILCPRDNPRSQAFVWTVLSTIIWCFCIPGFILTMLYVYKVPELASKKWSDTLLQQMILMYRKSAAVNVQEDIVAQMGGHASLKALKASLEEQTHRLFKLASQGQDTLSAPNFYQHFKKSSTVTRAQEEDIVRMFRFFGDEHTATIKAEEFFNMLVFALREEARMDGTETLETITRDQIEVLCRFNWRLAIQMAEDETETSSIKRAFRKHLRTESKRGASRLLHKESQSMRILLPDLPAEDQAPKAASESDPSAQFSTRKLAKPLRSPSFKKMITTPPIISGYQQFHHQFCDLPPSATDQEMLDWILKLAGELRQKGMLQLPMMRWTGESWDEMRALDRLGFLFGGYQPRYWYYEVIELLRKFVSHPVTYEQLRLLVMIALTE